MVYAAGTSVPVHRTRAEIEETLRRYGVNEVASAFTPREATLTFRASDRWVRFTVTIPAADSDRVRLYPSGKLRPASQRAAAKDQVEREVWRALLLVLKAKLESVESGVETFEQAFLANVMLPDGSTVGEHVRPTIAASYADDRVRPLLELGA